MEHDTTFYVAHKSTPEMVCGFRLRRGRGLHGAYMGLTWRATNSLTICSKLRARKSGGIEMRLVRLGRNGPGVSEMGLGCMGVSGGYGHADDAESIATIHAALEAGITMLDT
jgi:Aldo/keto reductase family